VTALLAAFLVSFPAGAYSSTPLEAAQEDSCGAQDLCRFPVLCYHGVDDGGGLSISPLRLRSDLQALYDAGFFLVTTEDLEDGFDRVPSDREPVMLTFDDAWQDQFNLIPTADGSFEMDGRCALGILEQFCSEHQDFGRGAVFFVSWDKVPFGQADLLGEKLNYLLDNGYCIGNHTLRHSSFMSLPRGQWGDAIGGLLGRLRPLIGLRASGVTAAAWPGGSLPKGADADEAVLSIDWEGSQAVRLGFVVNGDLASLQRIRTEDGRLRIARIDIARFTVRGVLQLRGLMNGGLARTSIHDPMPARAAALPPLRID